MKIWVISDTHFEHVEKMMKWCGRPENYEELLFKAMSAIPEEDVLIHLGDICMGKDSDVHAKYIAPLKCKKVLIKGNHDHKTLTWYMAHGWDVAMDMMYSEYFGKRILFSHKPQNDGDYDFNVHGHLHNSRHHDTEYTPNDKQRLVSVELSKYKLLNLEWIINNPTL